MKKIQEDLLKKLKELTISLQSSETELNDCVARVMQLPPDKQQQYMMVLDNIQNQIKLINIRELNKVKDVLGLEKFSGPALLSHIEICLQQSQLIAKSINQSKDLIEQSYRNSKYNPGTKSKMLFNAEMNMQSEDETENFSQNTPSPSPNATQNSSKRDPSAGDNPRLNKTPPLGEKASQKKRVINGFSMLKPQMVLLEKMIRIQQEAKKQKNITQQLRSDAYVDQEILRLDRMVDETILQTDKKVDEKILKLDRMVDAELLRLSMLSFSKEIKNSHQKNKALNDSFKRCHSVEMKIDQYIEAKITTQTRLLEEAFIAHQQDIKMQLSAVRKDSMDEPTQDYPSYNPNLN